LEIGTATFGILAAATLRLAGRQARLRSRMAPPPTPPISRGRRDITCSSTWPTGTRTSRCRNV